MSKSTRERALQQYADALREVMKEPINASAAMEMALEAYELNTQFSEDLCKLASMIHLLEGDLDSTKIALGRKIEDYQKLEKILQDTESQLAAARAEAVAFEQDYVDLREAGIVQPGEKAAEAIFRLHREIGLLIFKEAVADQRRPKPSDWSDSDTMIRVDGSTFRCECGANVFRKSTNSDLYRCNGCQAVWEGGA